MRVPLHTVIFHRVRLIFVLLVGLHAMIPIGATLWGQNAEEASIKERQEALYERMWELEYSQPMEALAVGQDLMQLLEQAPDSLMRMSALTTMASIYGHLGQFDEGIEASTRAEVIAEELGDTKAEILAMREKVIIYWKVGKPYLGLQVVEKALPLAEGLDSPLRKADLLHLKGMLYRNLGDFPNALMNVLESRKLRREANRPDLEAHSNNSLAILYFEMGDLENALEYNLKNLELWKGKDGKAHIAACYANLGDVHLKMGDLSKALEYQQRSLVIEKETGNKDGEAGSYLDIAEVYLVMQKYEEVESSVFKALQLNKDLESVYIKIRAEQLLGQAMSGRRAFDAAIAHLEEALEQARSVDSSPLESKILLTLSETYEKKGQFDRALDYFKAYREISDKMLDEQKVRAIAELQERYESEAQQREIELLKANESIHQLELEKQRKQHEEQARVLEHQEVERKQLIQRQVTEQRLRWALIVGILLLIAGVTALAQMIRQKLRTEEQLRRKNEEVNKQKLKLESQTRQIEHSNRVLTELNLRLQDLNQALEQSPVSVVITDLQGVILYVNSKFCEVSGYSNDEVIGKDLKFLKSGTMTEEVYRSLWTTARRGKVWSGEMENRKKSGELFWERVTVAPIHDEHGAVQRLLGIKEDVTQAKARQEETLRSRLAADVAEASDQAKSIFLKSVGQEMRSPLNSILGFCNLLAQSSLENEQLKHLNQIGQSGFQLLTLIDKILDFTSAESGTMVFEEKLFKPMQVAETVQKQFLTRAAERNIALKVISDDLEVEQTVGDEKRFRQVLSLLVDNAIKFTNEGSVSIRLRSRRLDEYGQVELSGEVEDTGIGMSPKQLKELFKPFTQLLPRGNIHLGSMGLGLALCQRICQLLGGQLEASSILDNGSTFRFSIKAKPTETLEKNQDKQAMGPEMENFGKAYPLRIMVAEDNRVNRRLVETMMDRLGYRVTFAVDGAEVLSELRKAPCDIIFMDLQMPNMSGIEATRRIRDGELGEEHRSVWVVAVTAFASDDMRQACDEVRMQGFVAKPFEVEVIKEQIKKAYKSKY